jgi:hypothetical protein
MRLSRAIFMTVRRDTPKEFCDFICRYERFHEGLILTCGRTLVFRRQPDIGKSRAPCGVCDIRGVLGI